MTGDIPMAAFHHAGRSRRRRHQVVEVGEGVEDLEVGDHVAASFIPSCGKCPSCQAGERNLCDLGMGLMAGTAVSDGTFRIQANGQNVYPYALLGTFSPYLVVHQTSLVKIDRSVPFEAAALVSCGVTTGFGSAARAAEIQPGDDVVIVGLGGVGTAALLGAVTCGARNIFAVDPRRVEARPGRSNSAPPTPTCRHHRHRANDGHRGTHRCRAGWPCKVIVTVGRSDGKDLEKYMSVKTSKGGICVMTAIRAAFLQRMRR